MIMVKVSILVIFRNNTGLIFNISHINNIWIIESHTKKMMGWGDV